MSLRAHALTHNTHTSPVHRGGSVVVLLSATEKSALVGERTAAAKPPAAVGKENQALPDPARDESLLVQKDRMLMQTARGGGGERVSATHRLPPALRHRNVRGSSGRNLLSRAFRRVIHTRSLSLALQMESSCGGVCNLRRFKC
jgi:hypothetical protein